MRESGRARKTKQTVADGERSSVGARLEGVRMLGYVTSKGSFLALKHERTTAILECEVFLTAG